MTDKIQKAQKKEKNRLAQSRFREKKKLDKENLTVNVGYLAENMGHLAENLGHVAEKVELLFEMVEKQLSTPEGTLPRPNISVSAEEERYNQTELLRNIYDIVSQSHLKVENRENKHALFQQYFRDTWKTDIGPRTGIPLKRMRPVPLMTSTPVSPLFGNPSQQAPFPTQTGAMYPLNCQISGPGVTPEYFSSSNSPQGHSGQ